jgi:hypothetical protein
MCTILAKGLAWWPEPTTAYIPELTPFMLSVLELVRDSPHNIRATLPIQQVDDVLLNGAALTSQNM